jgi:hypothetical protein
VLTGRRFSVALSAALIVLVVPAAAQAAFPGQNGRIAFTGIDRLTGKADLYTAEPGGDGVARLTSDGVSDNPVFSPDGSQLAFTSGTKVYIGDPNAQNRQLVLDFGVGSYGLDWSPDGSKLVAAFPNCADWDCEPDLYMFGTEGAEVIPLTNTAEPEYNPAWSPDGSRIAFDSLVSGESDVYTISSDGLGAPDNITTDLAGSATQPDWSPDGSKIGFQYGSGVYVSNPDGTGKVSAGFTGGEPAWSPDGTRFAFSRFINPPGGMTVVDTTGPFSGFHGSLGFGRSPDWQVRQPDPVPPASGVGFPRSKGATPVSVALVLNYNKCEGGNPNKQHGPPLAYPSCTPVRTGSTATVGTPDSNGLPAEAEGRVRFDTIFGDPTTPADEADLRIRVQQTDVRDVFGTTYPDYAGSLVLFAPLRTTDLWNAGGGPDGSGTMVDFPLRVAVPCVATAGPEGATCSVDTTVDAVIPGFVRERKRMLLQLGQVLVHYAGGDGNPYTLEDNRPLFAQGVFVP